VEKLAIVTSNPRWARAVPVLALLLATCAPTISPFSATAYEQATSLKVDALALMGKATEPYRKHGDDVVALKLRLAKAHEFALGRPRNEISTQQWAILTDTSRHLLGGFLARWQRDSALSAAFVADAQAEVGRAFDTIIGLESGKLKPDGTK